MSRDLARAIPGARFRQLPGVAHGLHTEAPAAFQEAVLAFLAAPDAPDGA
jgi:pimeloyl-ACP methyl ester carboxylesterase